MRKTACKRVNKRGHKAPRKGSKISLHKQPYLCNFLSGECKFSHVLSKKFYAKYASYIQSDKPSHVAIVTHSRYTWHQNMCTTQCMQRMFLPCLGWGSVPCSYEQSRCNQEAGSRLLHPLAQGLPLLQELLSSLSDTARSDCVRKALKCWFSKSMHHSLSFQSPSPATVALLLLEAGVPGWQGTPAAGTICCVFGLICTWVAGPAPTTMTAANNSMPNLPPNMLIFSHGGCSFHGPERAQRRPVLTETCKNVTTWRSGRQEEQKATDTCAIRWCCRFMTRDTAICILPNTATTSKILSSKEGAVNV